MPTSRNGQPVNERLLQNDHGRTIAPTHANIVQFDRADLRANLHGVQDHWDIGDHGYGWYNWNGMNVCHHYDEFGYHWWGFYVGSVYFWTRFDNSRFWWFDSYWGRWVFLNNEQWWWQSPDNVTYVYTDSGYYQYDDTDTGIVMTPDTTPPVDAPPDQTPVPAGQTTVYSQDGTRSVQVNGDNRDAYLYDLTATDPNSGAAQAKFIGTQVAGVKFDYVTANGIATQSIQQIELSYDDPSALSVVDVNGERRVDISGDALTASLINLADNTVSPVSLASGASAPSLTYQTITDDSGNSSLSLQSITLTVTVTDGSGLQTELTFDPDGNSLNTPAQAPSPDAPAAPQSAPAPQSLLQRSGAFQSLQNGINW